MLGVQHWIQGTLPPQETRAVQTLGRGARRVSHMWQTIQGFHFYFYEDTPTNIRIPIFYQANVAENVIRIGKS